MKKLENFSNCLKDLKNADFGMANNDTVYRTGVVALFNLTFDLGWKALQAVLRIHGVDEASTGSPREILKTGYKTGFVDDSAVWLQMLKQRSSSTYIYDESKADALILMIRDSFIPAFSKLEKTLQEKLKEAE